SEPIAADDPDSDTDTWVGCRGGVDDTSPSLLFDGGIGELLIYDQALSATAIDTLYSTAGPDDVDAETPGLVAGYHFDPSNLYSGTVTDLTGNGNIGYLPGEGVSIVPGIKTASYT